MNRSSGSGRRHGATATTLALRWVFFVTALFAAAAAVYSEAPSVPETINEALDRYADAHRAFVADRFDEAVALYQTVDRYVDAHPEHASFIDHRYRGFSMVEIVQRYRALGDFEPAAVHRVLAIYVERVDAPAVAAANGGRIDSVFDRELEDRARLSQQVCTRMLEALSGGALSVHFDQVSLDATITRIEPQDELDTMAPADRILSSLVPYPTELLYASLNEYDTFLFYWNHTNTDGRRLYAGPHGWGGVANIPIVPAQLQGPTRGRLVISAGLIDRPGTVLHELFHTFEKAVGIDPIHGYLDEYRGSFPDWPGEGEIDYYEYHLSRIAAESSLSDLLLADRNPSRVSATVFRRAAFRHRLIASRDNIAPADELVRRAKALTTSDPDGAAELLSQALLLHRYNVPALTQLAIYEHGRRDYKTALSLIRRAYAVDPYRPDTCYWMGVEHYHAGERELSVQFFTEALEADPAMASALQYRGFVYYQMGETDLAGEDFGRCFEVSDQYRSWVTSFLTGRRDRGEAAAADLIEQLGLTD